MVRAAQYVMAMVTAMIAPNTAKVIHLNSSATAPPAAKAAPLAAHGNNGQQQFIQHSTHHILPLFTSLMISCAIASNWALAFFE